MGMLDRSPSVGGGGTGYNMAVAGATTAIRGLATHHGVKYFVKAALKKEGVIGLMGKADRETLGKLKMATNGLTVISAFEHGSIVGEIAEGASTIASTFSGVLEAYLEHQEEQSTETTAKE